MHDDISINKILFLDIETVPQTPDYDALPDKLKKLWDKKAEMLRKNEDQTASELFIKAGIYAEFGKIVCISVGFLPLVAEGMPASLRLKSFYGDDEKTLLQEFSHLLNEHFCTAAHYLCAHNGKEFDFPYLARRLLINGLPLPAALDIAGKKPWEVRHLDTLELWKFGDYKNYTSLELLTAVFDIPTPKDDIDGSQIRIVYWKDRDLKRIVTYCQKDVIALAQLYLRYRGMKLIANENITYTDI